MGKFFTVEKVGNTREKTPEGYLLCREVPISRVGVFDYLESETGIKSANGRVRMRRDAEELFRPETVASFEGKPIVIGHDVFPDSTNWSEVTVGHVQNVRRGEGDLLLADLLIQSQEAIERVERGEIDEVSCGYDCDSVADGDGEGHQVGIVGNHVALVDKARCSGCKLGDGVMPKTKETLKDRIRRFFKDGDEEGLSTALEELPNETADEEQKPEETAEQKLERIEQAVALLTSRVAELENSGTADEEPEAEEEKQVADEDEEALSEDDVNAVMADAEALCPGIKRPAADSAKGITAGAIERVKREAIRGANITAFGDCAKLEGAALDVAFRGAIELAKTQRNPKAGHVGDKAPASRRSNAELNSYFKSFWNK